MRSIGYLRTARPSEINGRTETKGREETMYAEGERVIVCSSVWTYDVLVGGAYTEKTEKENGEVAANGVSDFYREPRAAARLLSPFDLTLAVSSLSPPSLVFSFSFFLSARLSPPLIGCFSLCEAVQNVQLETGVIEMQNVTVRSSIQSFVAMKFSKFHKYYKHVKKFAKIPCSRWNEQQYLSMAVVSDVNERITFSAWPYPSCTLIHGHVTFPFLPPVLPPFDPRELAGRKIPLSIVIFQTRACIA